MIEVEVKIKTSHNEVVPGLEKLGFERGTTEYEKDVYYNGTLTDLKAQDKALRIREYHNLDLNDSKYIINFKGSRLDKSTMTRPETEFEVPSFEKADLLLRGIGFEPKGIVEKMRIHYAKGDILVCLDNVTGLGEFVEFEIMETEDKGYEEALKRISVLLTELGLSMEASISSSYLSMLQNDTD